MVKEGREETDEVRTQKAKGRSVSLFLSGRQLCSQDGTGPVGQVPRGGNGSGMRADMVEGSAVEVGRVSCPLEVLMVGTN